jgi:hypothetical protein
MLSPFSPYASILGLPIDDVPVVEGNMQYFDAPGDFFLVYDVASLKSCVVTSDAARVTEWRWNPGYSVQDLQALL